MSARDRAYLYMPDGGVTRGHPAALAAESAAYCNSTATFLKFQGKGSKFLFNGTYVWIHTLDDGVMPMHPMKYKPNGKSIVGLKDKKGKRFFSTMNALVKDKGAGWVEYYWPMPGCDQIVHKVSYVRCCKSADGINLVVGCGLYKFDESTGLIATTMDELESQQAVKQLEGEDLSPVELEMLNLLRDCEILSLQLQSLQQKYSSTLKNDEWIKRCKASANRSTRFRMISTSR